jgi:NitT/TauT family transport system substrate-binding protein
MIRDSVFRSGAVRRLAASIAAGLLAAMTFGAAAGLAQTPEHVTIRLEWAPGAVHTPIFLAQERGYYKEAGIDLEIHDGTGSVVSIQSVGNGSEMIGLASLSQVAIAVGKGVPLVAIAGIIQKAPDAVLSLKGSGILKPKDVEGKRFGFVPGDSGARIFPAFVAANGIDESRIIKIQVSYSTLYPSLLQGNVDFITGWASPDALKIAKQKPIEAPIVFADHGVNTPGTGIFVTKGMLARHGDMLRAFLTATVRGVKDAEKDPEAAIDAIMKQRPQTDRAILTEDFRLLPGYLHTPNTAGHGYGWMAAADWEQSIALLRKYFDLPAQVTPDAVYTNDLLPKI